MGIWHGNTGGAWFRDGRVIAVQGDSKHVRRLERTLARGAQPSVREVMDMLDPDPRSIDTHARAFPEGTSPLNED